MNYPIFPSQSAYGSFPAFPTTTYQWGFSILGHYYGLSVKIPDLAGIPEWIAKILYWCIGWIGALFKYLIIYSSVFLVNSFDTAFNDLIGIFNQAINFIQKLTSSMGIFGIPIEIALIAGITIIGILGVSSLIKLGSKIMEVL